MMTIHVHAAHRETPLFALHADYTLTDTRTHAVSPGLESVMQSKADTSMHIVNAVVHRTRQTLVIVNAHLQDPSTQPVGVVQVGVVGCTVPHNGNVDSRQSAVVQSTEHAVIAVPRNHACIKHVLGNKEIDGGRGPRPDQARQFLLLVCTRPDSCALIMSVDDNDDEIDDSMYATYKYGRQSDPQLVTYMSCDNE